MNEEAFVGGLSVHWMHGRLIGYGEGSGIPCCGRTPSWIPGKIYRRRRCVMLSVEAGDSGEDVLNKEEEKEMEDGKELEDEKEDAEKSILEDLEVGQVVEFLQRRGIHYARVLALNEKTAEVESIGANGASVEVKKLAYEDILCAWDKACLEEVPTTEKLKELVMRGMVVIGASWTGEMSLDRVHRAMLKRSKDVWTTDDAAKVMFKERIYEEGRWQCIVATGMLMASERCRFKRRAGKIGWKALKMSVVTVQEMSDFVEAVKLKMGEREEMEDWDANPFLDEGEDLSSLSSNTSRSFKKSDHSAWTPKQLQILRSLEYFAVTDKAKPTGEDVKVLNKIGVPVTPEGARDVLTKVEFWSDDRSRRKLARLLIAKGEDGQSEVLAPLPLPSSLHSLDWTFPESVLEQAGVVRERILRRRLGYTSGATSLEAWRADFRGLETWCIDESRTKFRDDAISVIRGERANRIKVFIHIADMEALVSANGSVDLLALSRGESVYLPSRPLHMLPPSLMEAASFNDQLCGDTLTAEIEMDTATSEIIDSRVHAAVISPIARLDFNGFNARLESETNEKWSLFQEAARISQSFLNEDTEGRRRRKSGDVVHLKAKRSDNVSIIRFNESQGHTIVDNLLRLAGQTFRKFAGDNDVALPERPGAEKFALRCGTAPLRRYTDLLIQRQIKRIITGGQPISKRKIWALGLELEKKHHTAAAHVSSQRRHLLFQQFQDKLLQRANSLATIQERVAMDPASSEYLSRLLEYPQVQAEIQWIGRKKIGLKLPTLGLDTTILKPEEFQGSVGESITVDLINVDTSQETVMARLHEPPLVSSSSPERTVSS